MRIIVDADACPSIDVITELAKSNQKELILYSDTSHNLSSDYAVIKTISKSFQAVDMAIANDLKKNDILITQDYGLALIGLTKKAYVVNPKGKIYTNDNIDQMLFERFLGTKNRKQKIHMKGPKKRTDDDVINLINSINYLIKL